jgi:hypothetical protein
MRAAAQMLAVGRVVVYKLHKLGDASLVAKLEMIGGR